MVVGRPGRREFYRNNFHCPIIVKAKRKFHRKFPSISLEEALKSIRKREVYKTLMSTEARKGKPPLSSISQKQASDAGALPHRHHPRGKVRTLKARLSQLIKTSEK